MLAWESGGLPVTQLLNIYGPYGGRNFARIFGFSNLLGFGADFGPPVRGNHSQHLCDAAARLGKSLGSHPSPDLLFFYGPHGDRILVFFFPNSPSLKKISARR